MDRLLTRLASTFRSARGRAGNYRGAIDVAAESGGVKSSGGGGEPSKAQDGSAWLEAVEWMETGNGGSVRAEFCFSS